MEYIIVPDTSIVVVNRSGQGKGSCNMIYRDTAGELCTINFETCAANYGAEHENSSGRCIGERKMDEGYFVFYTSGIKTRIEFKESFVWNPFRYYFLKGTRSVRFHTLQKYITEAKYTTFDLS